MNLTLPVADKPVSVTTPLSVTSTSFDGDDLLVTFLPGGAGHILTSSTDLAAPFQEVSLQGATVTTETVNNPDDTFRVEDARSIFGDSEFFRVEESP